MFRFLGKTTGSAARSGGSRLEQVCGGGYEGLSTWELVNAAQSDDEDIFSFDGDDEVSIANAVSGDDLEPVLTEEEDDGDVDAPAPLDFMSPGDIIAIQAMSVSPPMTFPVVMAREFVAHDDDDGDLNDADVDEEDDDDVGDDYDNDVGDDYDDDLVPWKLKGRFVKQRITKMGIRKMGQRGGSKLKANKLPYYDNRPGFSTGKLRG